MFNASEECYKHELITEHQERILRHMLGIDDPYTKHPKSYRNYYCANHNNVSLKDMQDKGLVEMCMRDDRYTWYCCTDLGIKLAFDSHKKILLPKAKRKYIAFLELSDVLPDLTFKEFLTSDEFMESRNV